VGCEWTFKEKWGGEPCKNRFRLFQEISRGDIVLAYASGNMVAYVGEVADSELRIEKKNETGHRYKYWNQRNVKWWTEPNHFDRDNLPAWLRKQFPKRGQTITRFKMRGHTFNEAKSIIKSNPMSGSALADLKEDMVKAGLRNYFLSNAQVLERGLKIRRVEKEVARGYRPDFLGQDAKGRPAIIECKGLGVPYSCKQLARYAAKYRRKHKSDPSPRLLLVAFRFKDACRKPARKAGIELFRCEPQFIREP